MSIAAFYREWLPVKRKYTYFLSGKSEELYSEVIWFKCNVQNWKTGQLQDVTQIGTLIKDYRRLYMKTEPVIPVPTPPVGATAFTESDTMIYLDGDWYFLNGAEDWSRAGRGVKHFRWNIQRYTIQPTDPEPLPMAQIVDDFALVVSELTQVTPLILEGI